MNVPFEIESRSPDVDLGGIAGIFEREEARSHLEGRCGSAGPGARLGIGEFHGRFLLSFTLLVRSSGKIARNFLAGPSIGSRPGQVNEKQGSRLFCASCLPAAAPPPIKLDVPSRPP